MGGEGTTPTKITWAAPPCMGFAFPHRSDLGVAGHEI